ncbi:hypothetical protein C1646_770531 [Rhizophagus diaphanus]|nr:hypothetical protein C1646_770531 [Rhizophagus diaphanus] [Rhizophagus sp. MUCL 43196]
MHFQNQEKYEQLDELNNKFSECLDNIEKCKDRKGKEVENPDGKKKDKFNNNKKCIVIVQG